MSQRTAFAPDPIVVPGAAAVRHALPAAHATAEPPVVVVGAGPVGMRFAQELARRTPQIDIVVYGDEALPPYNRVRLSSFLAGELGWAGMVDEVAAHGIGRIEMRLGTAVVAIDRAAGQVVDARGRTQPYRQLVLATGSRPVVPQVPGIALAGVLTFRDLRDAERLMARRVRSRHTVVVGGGLLGLEAARAMRRFGTEVTVLEHSPRLMARQLDDGGAAMLRAEVQACGIQVVTGDALKEVQGRERVQRLLLRSGALLACDTLVVAAGIVPQVQLALQAGLPIGRGVRVDDHLRTADPRIFAIGECAEHRGRVYGLVAPGFEQAAVAAHAVAGGGAAYSGSVSAARLKVVGTPVFSIGAVGDDAPPGARTVVHADASQRTYRSVVLERGRLVGATAVGAWDEVARVQEAVTARRRVWPWQRWRLRRHGRLWAQAEAAEVTAWPDATIVCQCTGVSCGTLRAAIGGGAATPQALCAATGASSVCGTCRPQLQALLGGSAAPEPVLGAAWLWRAGIGAALAALALLLLPSIDYPDSAALRWRWDLLWRNAQIKQISGYLMLVLMLALATLGLRKRVRRIALGRFDGWRVAHGLIGLAALAVLVVHSGARLGANLNFALSLSLLGAAAAGALGSLSVAREHRWPALARAWRRHAVWTHVLLLWPLPVLLALHVLKFYFFGGRW
jgi:nitrite reductase (NADH) large subunit